MVHVQRHRHFDTEPALAPVASAQLIEIGDFLYLASNLAVPAVISDGGVSVAANQDLVHDGFLGVALSGHKANDAVNLVVRYATEGEFEFPAAAGTYRIGTVVTCAVSGAGAGGFGVLSQKVEVANTGTPEAEGLGVCMRDYGVNPTKVLIRIKSGKILGGPQPIA